MRIQKLVAVVLVVSVGLPCLTGRSVAQQTNQTKATAAPTVVATNFIAGAILSPAEIEQVLTLAKACGLDSPGKIETFPWLPTVAKGISVRSVERLDGRNTTFDTVTISKRDWGGRVPGKDAKWIGDFWAGADDKYSTLLRRYGFRKESIQIEVGKGVDTAVADKIMALIEANDVRFADRSDRREFDRLHLNVSKPTRLFLYGQGGYCIEFEGQALMRFEWRDDRILVTSVSIYMV